MLKHWIEKPPYAKGLNIEGQFVWTCRESSSQIDKTGHGKALNSKLKKQTILDVAVYLTVSSLHFIHPLGVVMYEYSDEYVRSF